MDFPSSRRTQMRQIALIKMYGVEEEEDFAGEIRGQYRVSESESGRQEFRALSKDEAGIKSKIV